MSQRNPFRPSFGVSPLYLAGREDSLQDFRIGLAEGIGSPYRAMLVSGARGIGKTVFLNEVEDVATQAGWVVARAYPDAHLVDTLVNSTIPEIMKNLGETGSKHSLTGASIAGIGSISTSVQAAERPAPTLISRLRELATFVRRYEAGVLVTVDEVQSADPELMHQLATAVQDLIRDEFDIAFVAAGLPLGIHQLLQHDGTTFLRRAERIELVPVTLEEARHAIIHTVREGGKTLTDDAASAAAELSQGYPYLIQLVGSVIWTYATLEHRDEITLADVREARPQIVKRMGTQVHRPAVASVPDSEMNMLKAMATLMGNDQAVSTGALAKALGVKPNALSVRRANLLARELIISPRYGHLSFTLPYMREYLLGE
ncbi:ATP-binding protein [Corynebacterium sp.]|uniref:ATP-binding protein n=1 Tax=Corynebacterium sp. TaxID=1720 RepID=UPI0026DD791E|nr:ATP-binding protein [Corynebacterium sp.]MDO5077222.1 AAA family ATPase [Corynebacterium sp.]